MARQDTRWESEGAEFLTLGNLLLEKIPAYKTYTNIPGYDLVATNPEFNTAAKIQVKSRWKTRADGFIIKNFGFDFIVIVKLNRGSQNGLILPSQPEFYIIPVETITSLPRSAGWGKILFSSITDMESYKNDWTKISEFLVNSAKWETILNVGCDGGGYKIEGSKNSDTWQFRLLSNSMWSGVNKSLIATCYEDAIKQLDLKKKEWANLYPIEIHKEFKKLIFSDVVSRKCSTVNLEQWRHLCEC